MRALFLSLLLVWAQLAQGQYIVTGPVGSQPLPLTFQYVATGSSQATIQAALNAAAAGSQVWFSGTYAACSLTLTVANVTLVGLNEGATFQCATASAPVMTVSGSGLTGAQIGNLTFQHITNSPTCPGGANTSTCGDGLQVLGGASRVKLWNLHANFNYYCLDLGWTTYSELDGSVAEFCNGDGVHFVPDATHKTMQWEVRTSLSEQNLGNGFDLTYPASFTSVQGTAPHFSGWTQTFCNQGYGFNFSASAATTSGIADVWMSGVFSSQNNNSGFRLDLGPNGGRNAIITGVYSEQAGTCVSAQGFAQATAVATNTGHGIEVTSSCDNTPAPVLTGGEVWQNSLDGILASCPGTSISNIGGYANGNAGGVAATKAAVQINATNVSVNGGFMPIASSQTAAVYVNAGDTPSVLGVNCASSSNCVTVGTQPTNGFREYLGNTLFIQNNVAATGACVNGSVWQRTDVTGGWYLCVNTAWVAK